MQCAAKARVGACASAQSGKQRARRAAKPLLPGLLGANAALAAAASAEPTPFDASTLPSLPSIELPALDLPALDLPSIDFSSIDVSSLGLDGLDPLTVAAGAAVLVVPLALSAFIGADGGPKAKAVPAPTALQVRARAEMLARQQLRACRAALAAARCLRCAFPPAAAFPPLRGPAGTAGWIQVWRDRSPPFHAPFPHPPLCAGLVVPRRPWRPTPRCCCWTSGPRPRRAPRAGPTSRASPSARPWRSPTPAWSRCASAGMAARMPARPPAGGLACGCRGRRMAVHARVQAGPARVPCLAALSPSCLPCLLLTPNHNHACRASWWLTRSLVSAWLPPRAWRRRASPSSCWTGAAVQRSARAWCGWGRGTSERVQCLTPRTALAALLPTCCGRMARIGPHPHRPAPPPPPLLCVCSDGSQAVSAAKQILAQLPKKKVGGWVGGEWVGRWVAGQAWLAGWSGLPPPRAGS